ncbi:phosphatidylinositol phosphate synthase [Halosaccharopolyspora lacisalsi]|uniref:phosphatidylinositol phosphate synthase n=1 Tax=Halosaccharopolyspora lacisalsi TaxID=1000566 RepID=UPI0015FC0B3E|nr:CDP-alcohol phosphatidyltransferase family protein [Halosaccharopolyspora lacisalsi]
MLNIFARAGVSRVSDPVGAWLLRLGLSPDVVTIVGTVASVVTALWFFPQGKLFVGTVVVAVFLMFDLVDGSMARARGRTTAFGAVLDASCDRIADGALFGSLVWWSLVVADDHGRGLGMLLCLVGAQVISYIKARAEANDLGVEGGLAERAERFVIILVGTGLHGLGVPYVLDVAVWTLVVLSTVTIGQRLWAVHIASSRP